MKNLQIKITLIAALCLGWLSQGHAIEKAGQIGQSWSFPVFLDPAKSFDQATYHFDTAYFLSEKWAASFSVNTQVQGNKIFYLELGPDFYPAPDLLLQPFMTARLLYTIEPTQDAGWISSLGVEIPLSRSYQLENLKFRLSSGGGQFFFDSGTILFLELVRAGLIWTF